MSSSPSTRPRRQSVKPPKITPLVPHSLSLGLELTFIPRIRGARYHEWRDKAVAETYATRFNQLLTKRFHDQFPGDTAIPFTAKADPFRSTQCGQAFDSWCIEVNGVLKGALDSWSDYHRDRVALVYSVAEELRLHPCILTRKRDGTVLESPTGANHFHLDLSSLAPSGSTFLLSLYYLEAFLCLDYANHPFIRWAFAQWFDDTNSTCAVGSEKAVRSWRTEIAKAKTRADTVMSVMVGQAFGSLGIQQRFAYTGKTVYPTYEFRFFDMPRTPDQLHLQIKFLTHWVSYWKDRVNAEMMDGLREGDSSPFTLTPGYYRRLSTDAAFARRELGRFWGRIGLDFEGEYRELCWDQHYALRLAGGKFV